MTAEERQELLRRLPKIDELVEKVRAQSDLTPLSEVMLKDLCRKEVEKVRQTIKRGESVTEERIEDHILRQVKERIENLTDFRLRRVINATGVILHTNLGRAPLGKKIVKKITEIAGGYSNLEFDLEKGERGLRYDHVRGLLQILTGAEDGCVVNNNAAAVLIALETMAKGREVIVSRGELIEIGGEFRIPEVMEKSGAILKEVGTTNRTHLWDYEKAIGPETALLLKVHPSNYRIVGFTNEVSIEELVHLGKRTSIPVMYDLGSGNLIDLKRYHLLDEPTVQSVVAAGADIVTCSGDKLLGGPQAGIILGRKDLIAGIMRNPLNRALRIDKLTLIALEATLKEYLNPEGARQEIPVLKILSEPVKEVKKRALLICRRLQKRRGNKINVHLWPGKSLVGGGSLPGQELETILLQIELPGLTSSQLSVKLRQLPVPIIPRVEEDCVLLDIRTIQEEDIEPLVSGLCSLIQN
ncbi:MAG: L-seryl-tRNA(Sec) selenium transferase [Syntrophales bacterium]|nr:L-seryl-tRNA(Sec) selenium transferase [Syntrophales bacterium]